MRRLRCVSDEVSKKRTGDLALRWEAARDLALRTPTLFCFVTAHKTHAIVGILGFPTREDLLTPWRFPACCPRRFLRSMGVGLLVKDTLCLNGTPREEVGQQNR